MNITAYLQTSASCNAVIGLRHVAADLVTVTIPSVTHDIGSLPVHIGPSVV